MKIFIDILYIVCQKVFNVYFVQFLTTIYWQNVYWWHEKIILCDKPVPADAVVTQIALLGVFYCGAKQPSTIQVFQTTLFHVASRWRPFNRNARRHMQCFRRPTVDALLWPVNHQTHIYYPTDRFIIRYYTYLDPILLNWSIESVF